jgi:hypothetical protein
MCYFEAVWVIMNFNYMGYELRVAGKRILTLPGQKAPRTGRRRERKDIRQDNRIVRINDK